ncbi:hypothetical protein JJV70_16075 [Streptomyces sp. JJ66]|uniref:hypothetical protein n=1 Tax=Streptomyces sp. JJ66 TaxID=2803843 RepID=UPI001C559A12|nr:hypothetical protein [Streptomyces sp. JJ66]MBW1603594.1 hypothetical protein [Streptomyces sp. JJ66]
MAAILPFFAEVPALVWMLLAALVTYLLFIGVFAVTAVYSAKPARRRAAVEMVRVLWIGHRRNE